MRAGRPRARWPALPDAQTLLQSSRCSRAARSARRRSAATRSHDERSLLALRVNGADLSLDHGYPARIIVPALPGVHNTKWVGELAFA